MHTWIKNSLISALVFTLGAVVLFALMHGLIFLALWSYFMFLSAPGTSLLCMFSYGVLAVTIWWLGRDTVTELVKEGATAAIGSSIAPAAI